MSSLPLRFLAILILLSTAERCLSQDLLRTLGRAGARSARTTKLSSVAPAAGRTGRAFNIRNGVAPAAADGPTIDDFNPASAYTGQAVTITGSGFDGKTAVFFGDEPALSITVSTATSIIAIVGKGASGQIKVKNAVDSILSESPFTFIPPPSITQISPASFAEGATINIIGTGFQAGAIVYIDGVPATGVSVLSPTVIQATVAGKVTQGKVDVSGPSGQADFPASNDIESTFQANAALAAPGVDNGLFLVPTPSFLYNNVRSSGKFAFSTKAWGNDLGTDSNRNSLGTKLLIPQTSLFGAQLTFNWLWTNPEDTSFSLALAYEFNALLKKVSYFNTDTKTSTNFNPFALHQRVGLSSSFFKQFVYMGAYLDILAMVSRNDEMQALFSTGSKNVFVYPDFNFGLFFNTSQTANQAVRLDINLIVNNGDANFLYPSKSSVIPSVSLSFLTSL